MTGRTTLPLRAWLESPVGLWTTGAFGVGFVALLDWLTGPEIAFSIFYGFPVIRVAWSAGRPAGVFTAGVATLVWLYVDLLDHAYSHPAVHGWNALVRGAFFALVAVLIARVRSLTAALREQAESDGLTGLPNAAHFYAALRRELKRAERQSSLLSLAYLDLDNFKRVNDTRGHLAGDEVLRAVAGAMWAKLRGSDLPARMGGDEFAVLLPDTDAVGADAAAQGLRATVLEALHGVAPEVGISIGVVTFTVPPATPDEAVHVADELMYEVKRAGKNQVRTRVMS